MIFWNHPLCTFMGQVTALQRSCITLCGIFDVKFVLFVALFKLSRVAHVSAVHSQLCLVLLLHSQHLQDGWGDVHS